MNASHSIRTMRCPVLLPLRLRFLLHLYHIYLRMCQWRRWHRRRPIPQTNPVSDRRESNPNRLASLCSQRVLGIVDCTKREREQSESERTKTEETSRRKLVWLLAYTYCSKTTTLWNTEDMVGQGTMLGDESRQPCISYGSPTCRVDHTFIIL
jgi:hypothetical protein